MAVELSDAFVPREETIGQRLRQLRAERGLSQRDLSSPGVSYAYISRIEAGARTPSVKALRMLARKLGVSPDYLETGSDLRDSDRRELRLAELELGLRLDGEAGVAEALRALLRDAEAAGDGPTAGKARIALGLAAATEGRHEEAVELLEPIVESGRPAPAERPDVYAELGRSLAAVGRTRDSAALFRACLARVATEPDGVARVRFAAGLGRSLAEAGDARGAEAVLRDALESAGDMSDPLLRVRRYRSLGRLAATEGRHGESLRHLQKAIALLDAAEDTMHLGRAHAALAGMLNSAGRPAEAEERLALADRLLGTAPDAAGRTPLLAERTRSADAPGDPSEAARRQGRESAALDVLDRTADVLSHGEK